MISREKFFMLISRSRLLLKCNMMSSVCLVRETTTHRLTSLTLTPLQFVITLGGLDQMKSIK